MHRPPRAIAGPLLAIATLGCAVPHEARAVAPPASAGLASLSRLENAEVGYSLRHPAEWRVRGQVVATDFARGARCEAVEVVDGEPPADSGPAAFVRRSFVQICNRPVTDGLALDEFMRRAYGASLAAQWRPVELGGRRGYQTGGQVEQTTIFLQTRAHRIQIVAGVQTLPDRRAQRAAETQAILDSFAVAAGV
jgi:hypothetical protein